MQIIDIIIYVGYSTKPPLSICSLRLWLHETLDIRHSDSYVNIILKSKLSQLFYSIQMNESRLTPLLIRFFATCHRQ